MCIQRERATQSMDRHAKKAGYSKFDTSLSSPKTSCLLDSA